MDGNIDMKLTEYDLDVLHDLILEALDIHPTRVEILTYWDKLPRDIQLDCEKYGVSDTPTKEDIYLWLLKNKDN